MVKIKKLRDIIYPRIALVIALILIICVGFTLIFSKKYIYDQSVSNLHETAILIENYLHDVTDGTSVNIEETQEIFTSMAAGSLTRITITDVEGNVLVDTDKEPSMLNNHKKRPEIFSALQGIPKASIRRSTTLGIDMLYYAVPYTPVSGNAISAIIRIAMPYTEIVDSYRTLYAYVAIVVLICILLSILFVFFLRNLIEKPLGNLAATASRFAQLNFSDQPEAFDVSSAEMESVATSLRQMAAKLQLQFTDIRVQKEALQAVLDGMTEAVLVVNNQGKITKTNAGAEQLFKTPNHSGIKGLLLEQIIHNSQIHEVIDNCLAENTNEISGRKQTSDEKSAQAATPEHMKHHVFEKEIFIDNRYLQVHISLIGTEGKEILLVCNDITRLKHLEKIRKDFVANVSHELKTPVTSIKGFTETLLYGDTLEQTEHAKRFLGIINSQTDRLQAIIDDLLMLSRLEQDDHQRRDDFSPVNIHSIIQESVQVCKEKPDNYERTVTVSCPKELMGHGNSMLLEQALINLLDNALKYSDSAASVAVACKETDNSLIISVIDSGFGIPKAALDRIFERFYRVDKGRSREKGGTGLGLSIVKHIALLHGGSITVESAEGKGSTFSLVLPKKVF